MEWPFPVMGKTVGGSQNLIRPEEITGATHRASGTYLPSCSFLLGLAALSQMPLPNAGSQFILFGELHSKFQSL